MEGISSSDTQLQLRRDLSAAHPGAQSARDRRAGEAGPGGRGRGATRDHAPSARPQAAACVSAPTPPLAPRGRTRRLAQGPEEAGPVRPRGRPPSGAGRVRRLGLGLGPWPGSQQREPSRAGMRGGGGGGDPQVAEPRRVRSWRAAGARRQ